MKISIFENYRIFTHSKKETFPIPLSFWKVTIFPTRLIFEDTESCAKMQLDLSLMGPVEHFTVFVDLENAQIEVEGIFRKQFIRYILKMENGSLLFHLVKSQDQLEMIMARENVSEQIRLSSKESYILQTNLIQGEKKQTKIFLGETKPLNFNRIALSQNLREILSLWHYLGQMVPYAKKNPSLDVFLDPLRSLIFDKNKEEVEKTFLNLYRTFFDHVLVPFHKDVHLEKIFPVNEISCNPFFLLKEGAEIIASLFFQEKEKSVSILPCLPISFYSGRIKNISLSFGKMEMEWSKKLIKKVILYPAKDQDVHLDLQRGIKRFRVKKARTDKGVWIETGKVLTLSPKHIYYLDRFEK